MRAFASDHFAVELPAGHRFPMGKYRALRELLVARGVLAPHEVVAAEPVSAERLRTVHDPAYVDALLGGSLTRDEVRRLGFPWSPAYAERARASVGGTLQAARAALEDGLAGALAGGTHHAHRDFGAGYCAFNDLAVAARWLLDEAGLERVLIFDVDVHQGDGTAALLADEPRAFTTSLHGARNFPARKATSDLDVPLADGTADTEYLEALDDALDRSLEGARPDAVLVQAGVDPLDADRLGRLSLSLEGLRERDRRVLARFVGAGLPTVLTLGGGYAEPIDGTLAAHVGTYAAAKELERQAATRRS
ncbi:MAG: histone deacetylase [Planctomycetota bacterium]